MEHHVYFWLKDECRTERHHEQFQSALKELCEIPLPDRALWAVPAAVELRPVVDQSWDYALSMSFASVSDHDEYQVHPDHSRFIETYKGWWANVRVSDLA